VAHRTFGNIAASALDAASFFYALGSPPFRLVSEKYVAIMAAFEPLTVGWSVGLPYGMGLMPTGNYQPVDGSPEPASQKAVALIGHGGEDYGSGAGMVGYNVAYDFSIVMAQTSSYGMNCSLPISQFDLNGYGSYIVGCRVYDAALQHASQGQAPRLNCSFGEEGLDRLRLGMAGGLHLRPPPPPYVYGGEVDAAAAEKLAREAVTTPAFLPATFFPRPSSPSTASAPTTGAPPPGLLTCRPYCSVCDAVPGCGQCKGCVGKPASGECASCYKEHGAAYHKVACMYANGGGCSKCWAN
jgi:hypothetical protein